MSWTIHRAGRSDVVRVDGLNGAAWFSPGGEYRYGLLRRWSLAPGALVPFILLNPSTADALVDDPTVRRCIGFAKLWGFPGLVIANLFAVRATEPKDALIHPDPIGPANDFMLRTLLFASGSDYVVCGWGVNGHHLNRGQEVLNLIHAEGFIAKCLGRTGSREHPRHPLYVAGSTPLEVYDGQL